MSRIDILSERLVEFVARVASRISYEQGKLAAISGSSMYRLVLNSVNRVANWISDERDGLLWCRLCSRGTFTKRGMYLHLIRVHSYEIKNLIEEELKRELRVNT